MNENNCENCSVDIEVGGDLVIVADDYLKLKNKPTINGVELTGNKTAEELGIKVENPIELIKELNTENVFNDNQSYDANVVNGVVKSFEEATNDINQTIEEEKGKTSGLQTSVANLESKDTELENSITELTNKTSAVDTALTELEEKDVELQGSITDLGNNKQDNLTAGDGIVITEDNVINSLGMKKIVIEGNYTENNPYFLDVTKFNDGDLLHFPEIVYMTLKEGFKGAQIFYGLYMFKSALNVGGNPTCYLILQDNSDTIRTYYLKISGSSTVVETTQIIVKNIVTTDKTNVFTVLPQTEKEPIYDTQLTNKLYVDTTVANALGTIEIELEEI